MSTFLKINYTKFYTADLTSTLQRGVTVTARKIYVKITVYSGKNLKQNIL